jgi:hypothetical protein
MRNFTFCLEDSVLIVEIRGQCSRHVLYKARKSSENVTDRWSRLVEETATFITSKRTKVIERETDFPFELRVNLEGEAPQW